MNFFKYIEENINNTIDLYIDMDGVLAEYDIGNFDYNSIRPINTTIEIVSELIKKGVNVKILSVCKKNIIIDEKNKWIKRNMPFFDIKNAIYISKEEINKNISSKELKSNYLKNNINKNNVNIVVDDDNEIIKYLKNNNKDIKLFQVSSLIK